MSTEGWGFCVVFKNFPAFELSLPSNKFHSHPSVSDMSHWTIIDEWASGVGKNGIDYYEFNKQQDGIAA